MTVSPLTWNITKSLVSLHVQHPKKLLTGFTQLKKKTKNKQTNKNSLECCEDDLHMIIPYSKWTLLNLVLEKLTTLP